MKTVFLDFDGVLFDTLKEAYIICRHAFCGTDYFVPVEKDEYDRFYRYKYLVYNSWQYYYVMKILSEDKNISDISFIEKYNYYMDNRDNRKEDEFDEKYYSAREDLIKNYHKFWDSLESPFEFFYFIRDNKEINPVIVSKKNKSAIEYRLNQYGANISSDNIYGKDELEDYPTKADFIAEYMRSKKVEKTVFVDDNSHNLKPCEKYPQITTLLAGWGNIAIDETGLTEEEVEEVLTNI